MRPSASPAAWLGFGGIAGCAALPEPVRTVAVLALVIGFGVPHGALDGELARPILRPRLGRAWLPVFALPYLGLAASVLVAWHCAPAAALAGFLLVSALHFGVEDGAEGLAVPVAGGLAIAVPALAHPAATAAIFAAVSGLPAATVARGLHPAALVWLAGAAVLAAVLVARGREAALAGPLVLAVPLALLPPLVGFAAYFLLLHGPRHMRSLIADPVRAPRVRDWRSAWWRAVPFTAATIAIGAALWPLFRGEPDVRLSALTLQGLSALTVPHLLVELWTTARAGTAAPLAPVRRPTLPVATGGASPAALPRRRHARLARLSSGSSRGSARMRSAQLIAASSRASSRWRRAGRRRWRSQRPAKAWSRQTRMKQWSARIGQRCRVAAAGSASRVRNSQRAIRTARRSGGGPGNGSGNRSGNGSGAALDGVAVRFHLRGGWFPL